MPDIKEKLVELLVDFSMEPNAHICDDCGLIPVSEACVEIADHLIANGVTIQRWISVEERLPEAEQIVLVSCKQNSRRYQYLAFYVPKKWLREQSNFNWDYEACDEYCEEADDYYVNEGWYERIYNWDDYNAVGIGDFVTHWMPLPESPKGD